MNCFECGVKVFEEESLVQVFQINPYPFDPFGPNPEALVSGYSHAWHFRAKEES